MSTKRAKKYNDAFQNSADQIAFIVRSYNIFSLELKSNPCNR